jgi:hypothetical protein
MANPPTVIAGSVPLDKTGAVATPVNSTGMPGTPGWREQLDPPRPITVSQAPGSCVDPSKLYYSTQNEPTYRPSNGVSPAQFTSRGPVLLCDSANNGAIVLALTVNQSTDAPGTAPTVEFYNDNGTPWAGDPANLVPCNDEFQMVAGPRYSAGGLQYSTTQLWSATNPPTLRATLWFDQNGNQVSKPTAPVLA